MDRPKKVQRCPGGELRAFETVEPDRLARAAQVDRQLTAWLSIEVERCHCLAAARASQRGHPALSGAKNSARAVYPDHLAAISHGRAFHLIHLIDVAYDAPIDVRFRQRRR